ncbi:hypothetical protein GCM10023093_12420 [Nemorincola caseinilytica]|uniref:Uncharacterized protein n=1 Tax=Nemorincola caseinilytica TaxID=2054315 RepID=A0ABP8NDQ6_9BACT
MPAIFSYKHKVVAKVVAMLMPVALLLSAQAGFAQVGIQVQSPVYMSSNSASLSSFVTGGKTYAHRNVANGQIRTGKHEQNGTRLDHIVRVGHTVVANTQEGFVVLSKDVTRTFSVAVIKTLDGADNPSGYTQVLHIDPAQLSLKEGMNGVFIRYADLGLANGTVVYGYSVFGSELGVLAVPGFFQVSNVLAPIANDVVRAAVNNIKGMGPVSIPALNADELNNGGVVVEYKIVTVPAIASGILHYYNGTGYMPVGEGRTLTLSQARSLKFQPAEGYMGTAVFGYMATNNFGIASDTAYGTIPVYTTPTAGASKVNVNNW